MVHNQFFVLRGFRRLAPPISPILAITGLLYKYCRLYQITVNNHYREYYATKLLFYF